MLMLHILKRKEKEKKNLMINARLVNLTERKRGEIWFRPAHHAHPTLSIPRAAFFFFFSSRFDGKEITYIKNIYTDTSKRSVRE